MVLASLNQVEARSLCTRIRSLRTSTPLTVLLRVPVPGRQLASIACQVRHCPAAQLVLRQPCAHHLREGRAAMSGQLASSCWDVHADDQACAPQPQVQAAAHPGPSGHLSAPNAMPRTVRLPSGATWNSDCRHFCSRSSWGEASGRGGGHSSFPNRCRLRTAHLATAQQNRFSRRGVGVAAQEAGSEALPHQRHGRGTTALRARTLASALPASSSNSDAFITLPSYTTRCSQGINRGR